ncbi:PseudoU_synth_2 domain-containing protein/S4 domain-containing protein [Cinnamomum micranthum f. kanehirae]|uniref:PseudoU_synth_2 domain-containing protein/S4 domain-containing protein n=1 Tax=Cinnamomum micranthum f. kanehirae TaxID=337451 RepID=A0A443PLF1_9MAGN|nr:PseudoU_synth_2 domain-containing protein/S4 domain-containing protein [Cinnamomum micranthum f. kanehirae]
MAAAATAASLHFFSSSLVANPSLICCGSLQRRIPLIRSCATATKQTEFNISFAVPYKKENLVKVPPPPGPTSQLLVPWVVRDGNGNLKLQSKPPASLLHAILDEKTTKKKKNRDKTMATVLANKASSLSSTEPKHSKAARRFYNQNFRQAQRLSKVLAAAGVASRRSSEELIFQGRVTVNGSVCKIPQTPVDPFKDTIYVNGNRLSKKLPPKLYFALNKPKGYICSSGEKESKPVTSLFDGYWKNWDKSNRGLPRPRLFTVGRLDVGTSGLIIVTNDGEFAQRLAHPSSNLSKEYIAAIEGSVNRRHLVAISGGTLVNGSQCVPDSVELLPVQQEISRSRLRIVVHEGRNHEVRELVKNAGLQIHSLKRVRIGRYRLPSDLGLGKYVELKQADLDLLAGGNIQRNS